MGRASNDDEAPAKTAVGEVCETKRRGRKKEAGEAAQGERKGDG
jgi:hypothetical protein